MMKCGDAPWLDGTCLTISVLSLQGVEPASLSPSSWTIMVFTDSVSPLLSLEDLRGGAEGLFTADSPIPIRPEMSILNGPLHGPGVLRARGRLLARFLIDLLVVVFIRGVRFLTGGRVVRHLVGGADVVHGAQLLRQSRQVLHIRRGGRESGSALISFYHDGSEEEEGG